MNQVIKTKILVRPEDFKNGVILESDPNHKLKNLKLKEDMVKYERILLENDTDALDIFQIKELLSGNKAGKLTDFYKYTEKRIKELEKDKRDSKVHLLNNTIKNLKLFHKRPMLNFNEITPEFLNRFEKFCINEEKKINSIGLYMRYIRTIFNDAIDEYNTDFANPIIRNYPFRKYKIPSETTKNRNLSIDQVRSIRDFQTDDKRWEIARDVFMLQFYLLGINIADLFYLKHENIIEGRLQYSRKKTGRQYNIKIEPEAKKLIEKYKGEKYLLWFADNCQLERKEKAPKHTRNSIFQYADHFALIKLINDCMDEIRKKLEIEVKVTSYFARHSVASIMREIGISKDDISQALGHKDPEKNLKVTGVYINEDYKNVDTANRKLLNYLKNSPATRTREKKNKNKILKTNS